MAADGGDPGRPRTILSRRTDRRAFLRDAARVGVGLAGLAVFGCQGQPAPTPAPASTTGKPSGRLVYGITAVANAFDPGTQQTTPGRTPFHAVWDTVTNLNVATGAVEPWLAESWRVIDDKTVEFKLRRGIPFHNGRELVAEDVKFTLERLLDPANRLTVGNLVREIDHIEIVDSHTFRAVAKTATPTIALTMTRVHVLPAAEFKAAGSAEAFFAKPIGTGAFRLKEFGRESFVELVAAETSWRKPKLAEIRLQALTEDSARIAALRSGQADLIDGVPPDQIKGLEGSGFKTVWTSLAANYALDLYGPPNTPHAKLEVRRAMAHAIDWATIVKEIYLGYGRLSNGLIGGPGTVGWADDPVKYPYDPAKARQLLAQAGFPNGFKTKSWAIACATSSTRACCADTSACPATAFTPRRGQRLAEATAAPGDVGVAWPLGAPERRPAVAPGVGDQTAAGTATSASSPSARSFSVGTSPSGVQPRAA